MSAVLEQAQFETVNAALFFAYRQHRENYQASQMNRMAWGPQADGKGLGGLDGAAVAGMIQVHVRKLGDEAEAIIRARHVQRDRICTQCKNGTELTKEFEDAIHDVMEWTNYVISGISNYRFREGVVFRHFGAKVHLGNLRDKCQIPERTAGDHIQKIKAFLQKKEGAAMHAISVNLREAGIVNDEAGQ